jgi:hypothetical protein
VVCHERAAACDQSTGYDECSQLPPHSILRGEMLLTRHVTRSLRSQPTTSLKKCLVMGSHVQRGHLVWS